MADKDEDVVVTATDSEQDKPDDIPVEKVDDVPAAVENKVEASDTDQPVATGDQPVATEDQPVATEDQPVATEDQPVATGDQNNEAVTETITRPPRTKFFCTELDEPIEILMGDSGITAIEPITVVQMFKNTVKTHPDAIAFASKENDAWNRVTYTEYYKLAVTAAKSFLKLELEPFHSVNIIGFNSPEWFIAAIGTMMAGGVLTGVYATNKPETCKYVAEDSKADIIVVEDDKQLQKILSIRDQLPNLKAIIQYKGQLSGQYQDVYEWSQFMEMGQNIDDQVIESKISQLNPACCASVIYTSGTVGNPKGVMISHDNITWTCQSSVTTLKVIKPECERVVSFLPLSHIAAQLLDLYLMMFVGGTTYFAQPDALKGTLKTTLCEVLPTIFLAVPRVWEKFMEGVMRLAPPPGSMKSKISNWAKNVGMKGNTNIQKNLSRPWNWSIADALVFNKVRQALGLTEVKLFGSSAAPLRRDVLDFFISLNIPIYDGYGMSEATGPVLFNCQGSWKAGTSGIPIAGIEIKLHEQDGNGEGELCYRGRNVMMGYHRKQDTTLESLDSEGWFCSGDLAVVDKDGFYTITGRRKELLITSGGENIAPVPIEDSIKRELPFISNVIVVGDHRNFLTCLLTLKCEIDVETAEPTDILSSDAIKLLAAKGSTATKVSDVVDNQDKAVFTAIEEGLERANANAVSNAATVKKWSLLDVDFSESGGELGPTQKLRRFHVVTKYAETIEALYSE